LDCAQCGSLQRFEVASWRDGLAFARAVGDLAGPYPEGRTPSARVWIGDVNPYAAIGMDTTFAEQKGKALTIEASPGFPVCRACALPLECQVGSSHAETRCGRCGVVGRYALSGQASALAPSLQAVIAEEHRTDRRDVKMQPTSAGPTGLLCPQCGAGLQGLSGPTVQCSYCKTVAYVPLRARPRETGQLVPASVFWIAFRGRSPERGTLEKGPKVDDKKAGTVLGRGLRALPGIELAPKAPGTDLKQWAITLGLTVLALAIGLLVSWGLEQAFS
jgi:hypothetical protein